MGIWSSLLKLLRPSEGRRTASEEYEDLQINARADLVGGKAMTPGGGFIDFESDSEKPRY